MGSSVARIALDGVLTIAHVEELRARLLPLLASEGEVVVDCHAADEVDFSFVQLLLATRASLADATGPGRLRLVSGPALEAALSATGVQTLFAPQTWIEA